MSGFYAFGRIEEYILQLTCKANANGEAADVLSKYLMQGLGIFDPKEYYYYSLHLRKLCGYGFFIK